MHRAAAIRTWYRPALLVLAMGLAGCWRPGGTGTTEAPKPTPFPVASGPPSATDPVQPPAPDPAPTSFVRSTSDTKSTRIIELRDGLTRATAFRTARDALNQNFTVDAADAAAGFLMTTWQASVLRDGVPDLRYRTRIIVRLPADDPKQLTLRAEANWQRGGDEWEVGFDSALLEHTAADLRAKLGKRP
jgi:hypothetical protein